MTRTELFPILADFLVYPGPTSTQTWAVRTGEIARLDQEAARQLEPFIHKARSHSITDLQELFTRTFDLNPVCSLEVGWHLFGEDYRRGRFLAFIRRRLLENEIVESSELPDHLIHLLPLLSRLQAGDAEQLGRDYVGPAVQKMVRELEKESNLFLPLLKTVESILVSCWGPIPDNLPADVPALAYLEASS